MNFISWSFLALLAVVMAVRVATSGRPRWQAAYLGFLLAASFVFYGWHVPGYVGLLLVSTTVDWLAARWIEDSRPEQRGRRRACVVFSLVVNLGMLGFFKYTNFLVLTAQAVLGRFGLGFHGPHLDLILPMGLSFYTFVALSYTIDVYRGQLKAERNYGRFLLFVSFFPHLMAGPVIRAKDFLYQMRRRRTFNAVAFSEGGWLIAQGLLLKVVCANHLGVTMTRAWQSDWIARHDGSSLLLLVLLFSAQLFCDFAGYSHLARGMACWLGFRFPVNFNLPFLAGSFRDFWRRWHITLSTWLRDYLYVPLGGSRGGAFKTARNLFLTMLLGGLWHGAAATVVMWGVIHGCALVIERAGRFDRVRNRLGRFAWYLCVQATVLVSLVFFRSGRLHDAGTMLGRIVGGPWGAPDAEVLRASVFLLPVVVMHVHGFLVEGGRLPPLGPRAKAVLAALMLGLVATSYGPNSLFIYFQF